MRLIRGQISHRTSSQLTVGQRYTAKNNTEHENQSHSIFTSARWKATTELSIRSLARFLTELLRTYTYHVFPSFCGHTQTLFWITRSFPTDVTNNTWEKYVRMSKGVITQQSHFAEFGFLKVLLARIWEKKKWHDSKGVSLPDRVWTCCPARSDTNESDDLPVANHIPVCCYP